MGKNVDVEEVSDGFVDDDGKVVFVGELADTEEVGGF
jgi:hypothetical protein